MASAYFRNFAIEHGLTVDYGYMYGKYKDFYISLKESLRFTIVPELRVIWLFIKNFSFKLYLSYSPASVWV